MWNSTFHISAGRQFPTQEFIPSQILSIKSNIKEIFSLRDLKNYLPQTFFQDATAECVSAKYGSESRKGRRFGTWKQEIQIKEEVKRISRIMVKGNPKVTAVRQACFGNQSKFQQIKRLWERFHQGNKIDRILIVFELTKQRFHELGKQGLNNKKVHRN